MHTERHVKLFRNGRNQILRVSSRRELRYGAAKRGSEKLTNQLEAILALMPNPSFRPGYLHSGLTVCFSTPR
jgi:hypothetical protein